MGAGTCVAFVVLCTATFAIWMVVTTIGSTLPRKLPDGGFCVLQKYRGHVCADEMENSTLCISPEQEYMSEMEVAKILHTFRWNGTQCYRSAKSRVCHLYFELVHAKDRCGEWCESVNVTDVNQTSLQSLPGCESNESVNEAIHNVGNCSDSFYYDATVDLCKPTCGVQITGDGSNRYVITSGIVGYVLAIAASCFNNKIMFKFPSVLVIYWLGAGLASSLSTVFRCCTSEDYFESVASPGPLCNTQVSIVTIAASLLILLPLFHSATLFWNVWFPIHAKRVMKLYRRRLHCGIALSAIAITLTSFTVIAATSINPHVWFIIRVSYHSSCGVTLALMCLVVWKIMKEELMKREKAKLCMWCCDGLTPEAKLSFVLGYLCLVFVNITTRPILNSYRTREFIYPYFLCESIGSQSCSLELNGFSKAVEVYTFYYYDPLISLIPYISLIYIVPLGTIKEKLKKTFCAGKSDKVDA